MSNNYIHAKKNDLNKYYAIILSIMILFGFYKNGILVFKEFRTNYIMLFKPLLFPLVTLLSCETFEYLKNKKISLTDNVIYFLLLSCIIPIKLSLITYTILIVLLQILTYYFLDKINLKVNVVAIFKIVILGSILLKGDIKYANDLENVKTYAYNLIDIFIGRGIGGVNSSSILVALAGYFILASNKYYKNEIPIYSLSVYVLLIILTKLIFQKVIIINSLIIFCLIFIAPLNRFSPGIKKERIIYSVSLGVLTYLLTYFISANDGVIIAILISSLINYINIK